MAIIKKFRIKSYKEKKPIIKIDKISLSFGKRKILDNINFSINESQILGLLGPNGVGKSTIFNLITGLITPKHGKIKINGEDVSKYPIYLRTQKFKVGYVPQYGGFFNDLTLHDNLKAIGEIVIKDKNLRQERIDYLLAKFELENIKNINLFKINSKYDFLDKILLKVLKNNSTEMSNIFFRVFNSKPKTAINFLSNKSSFFEDLEVILKMPKWKFLKELI